MTELRAVLDLAADAARRGVPAVLATVVRVQGSAYRRPGARLLLCPDGPRAGLISGGCLEGDVAKKAWWRTENGPAVVRYDTGGGGGDEWAFGLGCNGVVDVLLERLPPESPPRFLAFLRGRLDERRAGVLARVVGGAAVGGWLTLDADGTLDGEGLSEAVARRAAEVLRGGRSEGDAEVFYEVVRPPLGLVVCGAGQDAMPVVALAKELGWHVTVCDPRGPAPPWGRFPLADAVLVSPPDEVAERVRLDPDGAAVVMAHNRDDDRRFLRSLLPSPVGYVGALGPRRRTDALLAELAEGGYTTTPEQLARLHAPVGLDLGGDGPAEVALAILAEVRAALAGKGGGSLRDKPGPIHRRESAGVA